MQRSRVLLPEPEGPMRQRTSPTETSKLMSCKTCRPRSSSTNGRSGGCVGFRSDPRLARLARGPLAPRRPSSQVLSPELRHRRTERLNVDFHSQPWPGWDSGATSLRDHRD